MAQKTQILLPTAELVAVALISTFANVPSGAVGMTLPADTSKWINTGFVQVSVLTGTTPPGLALRQTSLSIDLWALRGVNTLRPDWGTAAVLAEIVHHGCTEHRAVQITVSPGPNYPNARVLTAYPLTDPVVRPSSTPGPGETDVASWAHYGFDMRMNWVQA